MSLIEVVVAISILGILATSALGMYVVAMDASKAHSNREVAITVSAESMEIATGWSIPNLVNGRTQTSVQSQWAVASGVDGIAATYPLWDPTATGASVPSLPLTRTSTLNGTVFTAETFIGRCYQLKSATSLAAGSDCRRVPGHPTTAPGAAPSAYTALIRVIATVRWTSDDNCSTAGACLYSTSTLIDPNSDVEWVKNG